MANKKLIAGGIIAALIIATITVVGLIPLMMYGSGDTLTQISLGMTTDSSSTSTSLSTSSIQTSTTYEDFSPNVTGDPEISQRSINAYEEFVRELGGESRGSVSSQQGDIASEYGAEVSIEITFNLTTPSNKSLVFEFSPQNLQSESFDVVLTLDSDDLEGEISGEFHLEITISIKIEVDTPIDSWTNTWDLEPVNKNFTV